MKTIALLMALIFAAPVQAQPGWRYHPVPRYAHRNWRPAPVYRSYPVYRNHSQVSTGSAVAGAVAAGAIAGIIGYQLGKSNQKASQAATNCKTVNIDNDQKLVCRDSNGNWQMQ